MRYRNREDQLNPIAPEGADDTTLGGYPAIHGRAPAFEGSDGQPYTVAIETEASGDPERPWVGYLVFVRWAQTGTAIMGHLDSGDLCHGASEADTRAALAALPLRRVQALLNEAIRREPPTADEP